jgi:hypothetical protein
MKTKILIVVVTFLLVLGQDSATAACNAITRYRLVTCACTGAPAIGSYCAYYVGGTCSFSIPGNYCGSDDQGHECWIGSTTDVCIDSPQSPSRVSQHASVKTDLATLVPFCGKARAVTSSDPFGVRDELSLR